MDRYGRVLAEEPDRVAHVLGPGRAVQTDHLHVERGQRGEDRRDVGAQQHLAALREQRDRGLDGQRPAGLLERLAGAEDGGLDLQDVLSGLDDDQIRAALHQAARLLGEDLDELAEADLAERRVVGGGQVAGRPDRPGHEAILARGLAGDLRGLRVDLERSVAQAPLVELQMTRLEGVRLDDLGAGLEHRLVHALDHIGAVQDERLVALARQAAVVLARQVEHLERGAHAAVVDHDAGSDGLDVVAHCLESRLQAASSLARARSCTVAGDTGAVPRAPAGLCDTCRHQRIVRTTRASEFSLCERSRSEPEYPRYPRLPVKSCRGYERTDGAEPDPSK